MSKKSKYILIISLIIMLIMPIWVYAAREFPMPKNIVIETNEPAVDTNYMLINTLTAIFKLGGYVYLTSSLYLLIETIVIWKKEKVDNKFIKVLNVIINILISLPIGLTCLVVPTITNFIKLFSDNKKTKITMNIVTITIFILISLVVIPILIAKIHGGYYAKPL